MKKIMYYEKPANVPANFVQEMHDINDRDFTRYEFLYCSIYLFILLFFLQASFAVRKSLTQSVEKIRSQMSETARAVDEPDATLVTKFVYNETKSEKKIMEVL